MSLTNKKWVVDDISNAALFDTASGDPTAYFDRLKKITISIDTKQNREYGGTSKYSFHLTEQDSESNIQLENAILDYDQLIAATGATAAVGSKAFPAVELLLSSGSGVVTPIKAATMIASSEKVIVASTGKQLTRAVSAPTSDEYTISAGVITLGDAGLKDSEIRVFYDHTVASTNSLAIKTTTKNKAYKFVAYGSYLDDASNTRINVVIIVHKCQMLGTFNIDMQRKTATTNSVDLAVLDPSRPDGNVVEILAS